MKIGSAGSWAEVFLHLDELCLQSAGKRVLFACVLFAASSCAAERQAVSASADTSSEAANPRALTTTGEASLSEIEAAERDLERAAERLDAQLRLRQVAPLDQESRASAGRERDARAPAGAPPATESAPKRAAPKSDEANERSANYDAQAFPADSAARGPVGGPCDLACRAFGSMERSTEHICSLAGADDPRCARARDRVRGARDRVTSGGCWCLAWGAPQ